MKTFFKTKFLPIFPYLFVLIWFIAIFEYPEPKDIFYMFLIMLGIKFATLLEKYLNK